MEEEKKDEDVKIPEEKDEDVKVPEVEEDVELPELVPREDLEKQLKNSRSLMWVLFALFAVTLFTQGFTTNPFARLYEENILPSGIVPPPMVVIDKGNISIDADKTLGNLSAEVTLIEWSDYQCGFCARFHKDTFPQIKEEYVDTGKVLFAYKHYPLNKIHPVAVQAAMASECAKEQNMFWDFHNTIYENQEFLSPGMLPTWATAIRMDGDQFKECVNSNKYFEVINADIEEGKSIGVEGTPAFLILTGEGDVLVNGAHSFDKFKTVLDEALN